MAGDKVVAKTEAQDLQKQEHKEERTVAGRFFIPQTDGPAWREERGCEH